MITQERLKELIEQGATIYSYSGWGGIFEEKLTSNHFVGIADDRVSLMQRYNNYEQDLVDYIDDLYETKEDAEWQAEFGNIARVERLELPTWGEIENIIDKKKRFGLNHSDRILARIITKDSIYYFKLCKDMDLFTFQMEQTYIGEDLCEQITSRLPVSLGKATKDNYTLACRKAKELFLGAK